MKEKDEQDLKSLSGFIFMCNGKTKPRCYQYRVFGLPAAQREIVEKIKPGMKLFLFDFEVKLLYGIYEATSDGTLNLERSAFNGRFPAQARFKICRECLPLLESTFRHAIEYNHPKGSKINPELNDQQVRSLLSLFRPLTLSNLDDPYGVGMHLSHAVPVLEPCVRQTGFEQRNFHKSLMNMGNKMQPSHIQLLVESENILQAVQPSQHAYYAANTNAGYSHPAKEPHSLPATNDQCYSSEVQQPYVVRDPLAAVQYPCTRYLTKGQMLCKNQHLGTWNEYYQQPLHRGGVNVQQEDNYGQYYNSYPLPAALNASQSMQAQNNQHLCSGNYYYQLQFQKDGLISQQQENVAQYYNSYPSPAAPNASQSIRAESSQQLCMGNEYHQPPLHREGRIIQQQENVVQYYNSYPLPTATDASQSI